jgi:D-inositol-3-phosphate glycosyltransferase
VVGGASGADGQREVQHLRELVHELDLASAVRFVAPQPHHLLSTYYRAADVCLVPSRSESFGLVALEAAACGTPVVAAEVGGLTTLVDHGRTGFLVEGRDPAVYAAHAATILDRPDLAAAMADASVRRAGDYLWSTAAARLRRVYADLTARALVECR